MDRREGSGEPLASEKRPFGSMMIEIEAVVPLSKPPEKKAFTYEVKRALEGGKDVFELRNEKGGYIKDVSSREDIKRFFDRLYGEYTVKSEVME